MSAFTSVAQYGCLSPGSTRSLSPGKEELPPEMRSGSPLSVREDTSENQRLSPDATDARELYRQYSEPSRASAPQEGHCTSRQEVTPPTSGKVFSIDDILRPTTTRPSRPSSEGARYPPHSRPGTPETIPTPRALPPTTSLPPQLPGLCLAPLSSMAPLGLLEHPLAGMSPWSYSQNLINRQLFGLNGKWILCTGPLCGESAGHRRIALTNGQ